jgi:hypothetical protein
MTKFLVKDIDKARVLASNDFDVNFPIVRTADAYLLYAEALVGTGQASMAKEWVDKVRVRAGIDPLATDPTMEEIFTERRKEFIGEGKRYYDLVRQGEAVFVNTLKVFVEHYELTSTYPGTTPTAADMLLPIPQPAMLVHPDWEQNPY